MQVDRLTPIIPRLLSTSERELGTKFPIEELTDLVVSHFDLIRSQVLGGDKEWDSKLKVLNEQISKHPDGKSLTVSIHKFVNSIKIQPVATFLSDILHMEGSLPDNYDIPELKELMEAKSELILSERGNRDLQQILQAIATRIINEFSIPQAAALAAGINSLAARLTSEPIATPVKPLAKLVKPEGDNAKKAIKEAIEKGLLALDLSLCSDLTDEDLLELSEKSPMLQNLKVKSLKLTKIPTFKNLRNLECKDCAKHLLVQTQPNLERLTCDLHRFVKLEQPVVVTYINGKNFAL